MSKLSLVPIWLVLAALLSACGVVFTPTPTEAPVRSAPIVTVIVTPLPTRTPVPSITPPVELPDLSGPYLGQTLPGVVPQIFAPGFISHPATVEYSASFSPDGTEFFFTRRVGQAQNLYETHLVDGIWSDPAPVAFTAGYRAHEPHITLDNATLYFGWFRPLPEGVPHDMDYGIWAVDRLAEGWSEPRYVGLGMHVSSDLSGQLYVTDLSTSPHSLSQVTLSDGHFNAYEYIALGAHPCIAPDGSYLIYDYGGGDDLFVRFRQQDGAWGDATELPLQDFAHGAGIASISPDGLYLFYTDGEDIYWVSTEIITALR